MVVVFTASFNLVQAQSSPPNPPSQLVATPSSATTINLAWIPPNDIVTGYKIMYKIDNGTFQDLVSNTGSNATTFLDRNLIQNHVYSYQVFAINPSGQSFGSNIVTTTLSPLQSVPSSPTSLIVTPTPAGTLLSWTPPENNGSIITGYKIEFSTTPNNWLTINNNTGTLQTSYQTTINSAPNYVYRVSAINSAGTQGQTLSATSNVQSTNSPILSGTAVSSTQVILSWIPPSYTYGQQIIGYKIELKIGSTYVSQIDKTDPVTSQIISGLIPDKTYTYRVTALFAGDTQSPPSSDVSITPLA